MSEEYDYVIVGGGTSGCLLANELATAGRVLLIEKGSKVTSLDYNNERDIVSYKANIGDGHWSEIRLAETLGGCSAVNGAVWITSPNERYLNDLKLMEDVQQYWEQLENILLPTSLTPPELYPLHDTIVEFIASLSLHFFLPKVTHLSATERCVGPLRGLFRNGKRTGSHAVLKNMDSITIKLNSEVVSLQATSDEGTIKIESVSTRKETIKVKKHVIISCGAYQTPNLLLNSPISQTNKNIGKQLREHPMVNFNLADLALESANLAAFGAFLQSPFADGTIPDFQLQFGITGDKHFFLVVFLLESKGKGYLVANDLFPEVHFDLRSSEDIIRWNWLRNSILPVFKNTNSNLYDSIIKTLENEAIFMEKICLGQHPCGTCSMGTSPESSVVNSRNLKMFGTSNLHICDASVLPVPGHANLQSFVYAMAFHAAKNIKADLL